jgi:hypothetical protein
LPFFNRPADLDGAKIMPAWCSINMPEAARPTSMLIPDQHVTGDVHPLPRRRVAGRVRTRRGIHLDRQRSSREREHDSLAASPGRG